MDLMEFNIKIMWKIKNIGKNATKKSDFFHLVLNFHWDFESKFIETLNQMFQLIPNQQANNLSYKAPENPKLL